MVHSLFAEPKAEGDKSGAKSGRSGSGESIGGGEVCLFSSNEELLDLDLDLDFETRQSDLHMQIEANKYDSKHSVAKIPDANRFSIDSGDKITDSQSYHHKSCCSLWSRYLKVIRWTSSAQLIRSLKMGMKRYYLLLLCLTLVIVSCLLASLVISRSVGDLDEGGSSSIDSNPQISSSPLGLIPQPVELEERSFELIDLIESGKTFAFTKYRLQVRVPKSSPIYKQQPTFLHRGSTGGHEEAKQVTDDSQQAAASETRFILTSVQGELIKDQSQDQEGSEASGSEISSAKVAPDPLSANIKPKLNDKQAQFEVISEKDRLRAAKELDSLLSASSHDGPDSAEQLALESELDPLEGAASDMHLSLQSVNRTMIDCFIVDTEKRYGQKVALEDRYRQVASARKVSFKKMMATIVECRHLTLSSLPSNLQITPTADEPIAAASSPMAALDIDKSLDRQAANNPQQFFGSFLNSWLAQPSDGVPMEAAESSQSSSGAVRAPANREPDSLEQKRQASYINMGLSMVSGIIPNTLWCGLGDRAANYSELGAEYKVDSCCRAHDHCPVRLKPFTTDYGLVNWSMSTRSHCDCDVDFNDCLAAINSTLSNVIRVLYFRFVGLQCIDVEGRRQTDAKSAPDVI